MPDSQPIALDAVITAEWLTQAATQFVGAECYYKVEWEAEILAVGGQAVCAAWHRQHWTTHFDGQRRSA